MASSLTDPASCCERFFSHGLTISHCEVSRTFPGAPGVMGRRRRSHIPPKLNLSLRLRRFVSVGEAVMRNLSKAGLRKSAVNRADADSRYQEGSHHSVDQRCCNSWHDVLHHVHLVATRPGRSRSRARAIKPLNRRSRSCSFGHTQGLLDSKGRPRPELLQEWQWSRPAR